MEPEFPQSPLAGTIYVIGFVQGDTTGLSFHISPNESIRELKETIMTAAELRVGMSYEEWNYDLVFAGEKLKDNAKIHETKIHNFGRIDIVRNLENKSHLH